MMHDDFPDIIKQATGADSIELTEVIQELWSGYGTIRRYRLTGCARPSIVVKHVRLSNPSGHPRGWNTGYSHQRKLRSYRVESAWYRDFADQCDACCRVAACLALEQRGDETLMVLEDLDTAGFPARREVVSQDEIATCLGWLAYFHAAFFGSTADGLWEQGTYWHLATRPDELAALDDLPLKNAAAAIDARLQAGRYRTLVHGDAKLANFCFSTEGTEVAAVDFQYVGGGCGVQDLAYFLGSCLSESECARQEGILLNHYFAVLRQTLASRQPDIVAAAVEEEWRMLFPWAWTDFHRFLKGWCPGHWKLNDYSERLAQSVLAQLESR